ncbi:MAG: MATE family efflux transporter [Lachnospiraceae bacterium]|nr:MATE family efflux transporter [Lachnospiraceae bacterium]
MNNKMGTEKMSKLILTTGVPLMLSLLINSLYNFVDSVFVSRVAEDALTAISLSAPVQMFVSALGLGNAVGLNAAISKALGEKNNEKVERIASAAIFVALCEWILISLVCMMGVRWYFDWQCGGNDIIANYGRDYLSICMLFSLGQMGQWVFDRFAIASGKSHLFLFTLSAASITNIILDPIFIFVFHLGTMGAAIATVIGQFVGALAGIYINRKWNKEIAFSFTLHPDISSIKDIIRVGFPSTLVQVVTSFVNVAMNTLLLSFSSTAVAVFGVCCRMQGICTVAVHGINNGVIPIVAYNYGARMKDRVSESIRYAVIYSFILYVPLLLILELFPDKVLMMFNASTIMLEIGEPAVRVFALVWLISIPNLVISSALQGLSKANSSMLLTMLRQAVLPLAFAYTVSRMGQINLIWFAFVVAEILMIYPAINIWKNNLKRVLD